MVLCPYVHAHYKLNSASGFVAIDSSPNGYNGALINMEGDEWGAGKLNNCLTFNATGEYVNCGNIANFGRNNSFSYDVWLKTSSSASYQCFLSKIQYAWHGIQCFVHNNKIDCYFICNGGGQLHFGSSIVVNDGNWHHVVITYNGSGLVAGCNVYVDNVNVTYRYADILSGDFANTGNFQISCRLGTNSYFQGSVDEVVIYSKELSVAEVAERWNSGNGTETISGNPPNTPNTPNPTNGETGVEYNRDLTWICTHPDGLSMVYDVYFDTVTPPITKVSTGQALTSYNPANYDSLQKYYWKIVARDICGNETSSPIWDFTSRNEPPIIPNTPSPNNNAVDISTSGTIISWSSGDYNPDDTVTYDIYFGLSSNPPLIVSNHTTTSYTLTPLLYDSKYYWKIVARDSNGAETASPIWNFTTASEGLSGYTTYDPRETIIGAIGNEIFDFNRNESMHVVKVNNDAGHEIKIPIYLDEKIRSRQLPNLPFISLKLANTIYEVHDIAAAVRKRIAYIDVDIVYADMDDITIYDFGKAIRDKIYDYIRSYQESITGIYFMTIENERMIEEENENRQVVFHYVMTLRCEDHDAC